MRPATTGSTHPAVSIVVVTVFTVPTCVRRSRRVRASSPVHNRARATPVANDAAVVAAAPVVTAIAVVPTASATPSRIGVRPPPDAGVAGEGAEDRRRADGGRARRRQPHVLQAGDEDREERLVDRAEQQPARQARPASHTAGSRTTAPTPSRTR
jgi:hypothetical protein